VGKTKFWSRVGHWFGNPERPFGDDDTDSTDAYSSAAAPEEAGEHRDVGALAAQKQAQRDSGAAIVPPAPDGDRMEQAYARIIDLVGSIQKHLELQDQRAQRMGPTLDRLAEGLTNIPKAAEKQLELLAKMTAQLEDDAERATRAEGLLSQLPHIADAQRETVVSMGRQLDVLQNSGAKNSAALDGLHQAVSVLTQATNGSTTALKQIHVDSAEQGEQLAQLMREHTRRLTLLAGVAIVLAVVAGLVAYLR